MNLLTRIERLEAELGMYGPRVVAVETAEDARAAAEQWRAEGRRGELVVIVTGVPQPEADMDEPLPPDSDFPWQPTSAKAWRSEGR